MKTLSDIDFKGKRVLLRTDINSDVLNGKVLMSERIKEASITIKELLKKKAKVVVLAHQGTPQKEDFLDLSQHSKLLNKFVKVKFVKDVVGEIAIDEINKIKPGEAILLDNVRFVVDEFHPENPENVLIKVLVPCFDYYINDAFSVSHREQTSIISFPKYLKSCAGRTLEKEVKALEKVSIKSCLYILGGAKPNDNIKLLRGKKVLACGLFGQLCVIAKGKNLGYQNEYLKKESVLSEDILEKLKGKLNNVETPVDFAVNKDGKRIEYTIDEFPIDYRIDDIGEKTIKKYTELIKRAPAIYMKGPAGFTDDKKFSIGTEALLKAVANCKGFTLIGGGHLSDTIERLKINKKKYSHISLSGGALLSYVAGEKLPGLEALGIKRG
ncbi:MAG: phosphoglycerate kinase [Nanoarchaeota archaeon]|nr:phosphoglycerate kinase [Nanoarchaeota archaeon]